MTYFYLNSENRPVGPMDLAAIRKLATVGFLSADVLVCEAGSEDWVSLSEKIEPALEPETPKPPRTAPPARSAVPPRRYTPPPPTSAPRSSSIVGNAASTHPDWFPLASLVAGIVALVAFCVPLLSFLMGGGALTLGILGHRLPDPKTRPFAIAGISTGALALIVSLGIVLFGVGGFGNAETRFVGTWRNDMSMQLMNIQADHSVVVTFHENGRFTELSGVQTSGANYDTGQAMRFAGGGETTGYWKWDPARKAVVTRHDGRNQTGYFDGATNDGRSLSVGPLDTGPSSTKAQEEFWVFKTDPDDSDFLIGLHPTMYHNRTMRFHRID